MSMPFYLKNACESIDATVFSGDALYDKETLKEFEAYLGRWTRELKTYKKFIEENKEDF